MSLSVRVEFTERMLHQPSGVDYTSKFAPFADAWDARLWPILAVAAVRSTTIASGKNQLAVYSLNSSIGCGEKRHLPAPIADDLSTVLESYISRSGLTAAFELVGKTLDTHGFRQNDIQELCEALGSLGERLLPVLVTHHNLLPQAILRVQLYTEVMNAGLLRSRFSSLKRPILYCHGHVHDQPIEIVTNPVDSEAGRIIAISAPELRRGYNIIQVEYGSRRFPLGCRVFQFQLSTRDGDVSSRETSIPLYPPGYRHLRVVGHERLPGLIATLPEQEMRFEDVVEKAKSANVALTRPALADVLREGEWLGLLEITDRQEPTEYWRVRKVGR